MCKSLEIIIRNRCSNVVWLRKFLVKHLKQQHRKLLVVKFGKKSFSRNFSFLNLPSFRLHSYRSAQNPDEIHIAPLGRVQATTFTASTNDQNPAVRETTVYTTQGKLNIADPFTTHTLKADATSQQLAEAEAASAFNTATSPTTPAAETVFAPKISSTEKYSTAADFNSPVSESASHDTVKYETAAKGKVFGGQDTTADTKKHPKENPFNLKEKINPRQAN